MRNYFGTDGIRGVANVELTPELAFRLGQASGYVLKGTKDTATFLMAKDTRLSSDMLEYALASGLMSVGVNVIRIGVVPTPAVAYLTKKLKADAGVMISASHNPFQDNGIKFFDNNGYKLSDEVEEKIEVFIDNTTVIKKAIGTHIGSVKEDKEAYRLYVDFLADTVSHSFVGVKVVLDCANGASYKVAPMLFDMLGAETVVMEATPTGSNINVACGSTHPEKLQQKVLEEAADIGLAFDGDADRLIAVDNEGDIVDGDGILYILARSLGEQQNLSKNTVVSTVMSNFGFEKALKESGLKTVQTTVGDRYVLEEMMTNGFNLGGEQSGHIIFLNHNTTGDGLLTAIQIVNEIVRSSKTLKGLLNGFKKYPQLMKNVPVADKKGWERNETIQQTILHSEKEIAGKGRILVRASGTENLIRVMAEGERQEIIERIVQNISHVIEREIG